MELRGCYIAMLVLSLVCVLLAEDEICVYKACSCGYNKVTCENLQSIPPVVNGSEVLNVTHAIFNAGNISDVEDYSLPPHLVVVHFINNPISHISPHAFQSSSATLDSLAFRSAALTTLPDALLEVKNLTHLVLTDTHIQDWNTPVLQHINSSLRSINLQNVGLSGWPEWLSNLPLLEAIIIVNSAITPVPDYAFNVVQNTLKTLDLLSVKLLTIPNAISGLNLSTLSLSNNSLIDVQGIPKSKFIDLSFNAVADGRSLSVALLPSAETLHTLYMDSNNLTAIPDLSKMINMEHLVLSLNQISNPAAGLLPQSLSSFILSGNQLASVPQAVASLSDLQALYLSSNLISEITATTIPAELQQLHLDDNKISEITSASFPTGSSLTLLNLQFNPITKIDPSAFKPLQKLRDLNLDNTKLTSVPLAIASLSDLKKLSMVNIPQLTCMCPRDTSLVQWFSSGIVDEVYGSCNNGLNIKDFYAAYPNGQDQSVCSFAPTVSSSWCTFVCFIMFLILYVFRV